MLLDTVHAALFFSCVDNSETAALRTQVEEFLVHFLDLLPFSRKQSKAKQNQTRPLFEKQTPKGTCSWWAAQRNIVPTGVRQAPSLSWVLSSLSDDHAPNLPNPGPRGWPLTWLPRPWSEHSVKMLFRILTKPKIVWLRHNAEHQYFIPFYKWDKWDTDNHMPMIIQLVES